jgi:hypothetical protein
MNEPDPTPTPDNDVDRTNDFAALTAAAKRRCLALRAAEAERDALAARLDATLGHRSKPRRPTGCMTQPTCGP